MSDAKSNVEIVCSYSMNLNILETEGSFLSLARIAKLSTFRAFMLENRIRWLISEIEFT